MKFPKQSLTAFLCTILVVACSGSNSGSVAPTPTSLAVIDANSAAPIAGGVIEAVFASGRFGDLVGGGGSGGLVGQTNNGLSKVGGSQPGSMLGYFAKVPIPGTNTPCAVDGSVTVSGNVADPTTLSTGDRLMLEFFDCDDGFGQVLNGIYELLINSFSGDLGQLLFTLSATSTFTGFEVMEGQELTSLNGDATLDLDTSMPLMTSVSVSGDSISVSDNTDTATLRTFQTDVTHDASVTPEAYTYAASGTLTSTLFEGEVNYSTPVTFQGFAGEYPHTGELLITGAGGSSVRLIALDNVNVRLEIDPGDGSGVITQDTTWAELADNVP